MRSEFRTWMGAMLGLTPLLFVLIVQSVFGLTPIALIAATIASLTVGPAIVRLTLVQSRQPHQRAEQGRSFTSLVAESTDSLTGLPTFQPFSRRLLTEFQHIKAEGGKAAIVLADISELSGINEEFGVMVGDQALQHVGACLTKVKRANDVVARAGDDEFALVLPDCDLQGAEAFVSRAQTWLKERPIEVTRDGAPYFLWVGLCAGVAICSEEAVEPDEVIAAAIDSLGIERIERDRRQSRWAAAA